MPKVGKVDRSLGPFLGGASSTSHPVSEVNGVGRIRITGYGIRIRPTRRAALHCVRIVEVTKKEAGGWELRLGSSI